MCLNGAWLRHASSLLANLHRRLATSIDSILELYPHVHQLLAQRCEVCLHLLETSIVPLQLREARIVSLQLCDTLLQRVDRDPSSTLTEFKNTSRTTAAVVSMKVGNLVYREVSLHPLGCLG